MQGGQRKAFVAIAQVRRPPHRHRPRCHPAIEILFGVVLQPPFLTVVVAEFLAQLDAAYLVMHLFVGVDEEHGEHVSHLRNAEELAVITDFRLVIGGRRGRAAQAIRRGREHGNQLLFGFPV